MMIAKPILPGFHPDLSICRVGEDYYIVNSTAEWFPGVLIHHSRDLKKWSLIGHVLTRQSQLDLRGVTDSAGVWAPSISHADGKFWLIYTNIRNTGMGRPFKDIRIFITTATDVRGPWSDPVRMDSVGFDPSIFHDGDGRKYLVNMEWDFRKGRDRFGGIVIQEFDPETFYLLRNRTKILEKPGVLIEGPNLYQKDDWYFLMLTEGGTGWNHGISAARSQCLLGLYESDPQPSVMTTRDDFDSSPLDPSWSSLRVLVDESWASLSACPGWLRLRGRDSLHSLLEQSLVARRLTSIRCTVETRMGFAPARYTQMAGLVLYYDTRSHYYLRVSRDEALGVVVGVTLTDDGSYDELGDTAGNDWLEFHLRAVIEETILRFYASPDGHGWIPVGPELDMSKISDDYGSAFRFTGAMAGVCCQDLAGDGGFADFDFFQLAAHS